MTCLFRFAHISDLHFAKPTWTPSQFFSKRWLGNLNLLFSRKREYAPENLYSLIEQFKELGVTHVLITGDLSTTSFQEEFRLSQAFVQALNGAGFPTFILPGNHDNYTRRAEKLKLFYQFFEMNQTNKLPFTLKKDRLSAVSLGHKWWLILLDTAPATSWLSSCGLFDSKLEQTLAHALSLIPADEHIILANHFPFFQNDSPRKTLKRGAMLQEMIQKHPNIRFYLHGHTHRHSVADLRASHLPIILDSGSTAHKERGSWNLIDIGKEECRIQPFFLKGGAWAPQVSQVLTW